jgi:hypothetical protein
MRQQRVPRFLVAEVLSVKVMNVHAQLEVFYELNAATIAANTRLADAAAAGIAGQLLAGSAAAAAAAGDDKAAADAQAMPAAAMLTLHQFPVLSACSRLFGMCCS